MAFIRIHPITVIQKNKIVVTHFIFENMTTNKFARLLTENSNKESFSTIHHSINQIALNIEEKNEHFRFDSLEQALFDSVEKWDSAN